MLAGGFAAYVVTVHNKRVVSNKPISSEMPDTQT